MKDPYDVLGVPRGATQDEIKKAYRKLAKELHPDRHPDNPRLAERFKEVTGAYHVLGDEKLRQRFDRGEIDASGAERAPHYGPQHGPRGGRAQAGGFEGFRFDTEEPEDLFSDLFSAFRRGRGQVRARGGDVRYNLSVSFIDAARGTTKRLGLASGKTLDVKIPVGLSDGQQIRLKGQGEPGLNGGPAGDALIEVKVEPHPFFTRTGSDIHVELPVSLPEAVLGAKIEVPTLAGTVALTVPKGSNSGTTLRLKGKGIAGHAGLPAGDQYVKLKVVLPDAPDAELEQFARSWSKKHEYDPRGRLKIE